MYMYVILLTAFETTCVDGFNLRFSWFLLAEVFLKRFLSYYTWHNVVVLFFTQYLIIIGRCGDLMVGVFD